MEQDPYGVFVQERCPKYLLGLIERIEVIEVAQPDYADMVLV